MLDNLAGGSHRDRKGNPSPTPQAKRAANFLVPVCQGQIAMAKHITWLPEVQRSDIHPIGMQGSDRLAKLVT